MGNKISQTVQNTFSDKFWPILGILRKTFGIFNTYCGLIGKDLLWTTFFNVKKVTFAISRFLIFFRQASWLLSCTIVTSSHHSLRRLICCAKSRLWLCRFYVFKVNRVNKFLHSDHQEWDKSHPYLVKESQEDLYCQNKAQQKKLCKGKNTYSSSILMLCCNFNQRN